MAASLWAPGFDETEVQEVQDSVSENLGEGFESASVQLMCAWADRHDVVAEIVGGYYIWPYAGAFIKPPYATSAAIKPFGGKALGVTSGAINYDKALITINYSHRDGEDPEDLYSESFEPTCEFLTLDYKKFSWANDTADGPADALLEDEAPGQLLRGANLVRTIYKLDTLPGALLTCFGCVNQDSYVSATLGLTFPAETLLYSPPALDRTRKADGSGAWDVQVSFGIKPNGWNKFWRSKTQDWAEMWDNEAEQIYKSYPTGDFSSLLF
jgi:hypothetical protein